MLDKKMFLRICLLVFTGISCSVFSKVYTTTAPTQEEQPGLYSLEDALTLAAQTLQADPHAAIVSGTIQPDDLAAVPDISLTEQTESEENTGETDLSISEGIGEGTGSSDETSPDGEPTEESGNSNSDERLFGIRIETADPTDIDKIEKFKPDEFDHCPTWWQFYKCRRGPVLHRSIDPKDLAVPILPPPIDVGSGSSDDGEEESEDSSEAPSSGVTEEPHGIEIPPIYPHLPGEPPLPPIQPPIFP